MKWNYTLPIVVLVLCSSSLRAQAPKPKEYTFQVLPSVFHTPETSWGVGAIGLFYHFPKEQHRKKSNAQVFLDATLNKQLSFQSDFNIFTKGNDYYIKGSHDLSKFPEFYFGIGNQNDKSHRCLINIAYADIKLNAYKKIKKEMYIGPILHHQTVNQLDKIIEQDGFSINDMGYASTGFGLGLLVDKRNNILNPSKGHYIETKLAKYVDHSHGTDGFWHQTVDIRHYHTFKKLVLNSNLYVVHNQGAVPFRVMPRIGGARFLRGYYAGRFRDNNMSLFQAEVRRPLFWRIGVAAFSGIGQVYKQWNDFEMAQFHYNYGAGLRFQIHKNSSANIRVDYGRTKDSHGFYVVFGECF